MTLHPTSITESTKVDIKTAPILVNTVWCGHCNKGKIGAYTGVTRVASEQQTKVGQLVRQLREQNGLSVRGLAAAAKVDSTWLSRVEHGIHLNPDPKALHRLAQVLDVETMELFQAADYSDGLPGFAPYLRSKYDLPPEAIDQLSAHFELLAQKYDVGEGTNHDQHHSQGP